MLAKHLKIPEEIAQWVINNRYPRNEKEKVSDAEMYHSLVESITNLCNMPVVSQRSEQLAIAALDKIAHPIKYLQNEAEKDGCKLDGYMAIQLTQDANFYQEIADKALKAIANCG